jgi:glycosyltransferase 2 family protein
MNSPDDDTAGSSHRNGRWKRIAVRAFPALFYTAIAVFVVLFLLSVDFGALDDLSISFTVLAFAILVGIANRYWLVLTWLLILRGLGAVRENNYWAMAHVYAKSWLGRYIPGTAPWILGKIYFASQQGISKTKLAVSSLMEGGVQLVVQLLVGVAFLLIDPRVREDNQSWLPLLVFAAVVGMFFLHPRILGSVLSLMHRVVKKRPLNEEDRPSWRVLLTSVILFIGAAILSGVSAALVALSIYPELTLADFVFVAAALNFASAISIVAVFAPGGIGVREFVLVAMLSVIMPPAVAFVVAVVLRLWSIGTDFMFLGSTRLGLHLASRRSSPS